MFKDLIAKMKNQKGFTLIELLVVISIIGILAAIITVSSSSSRAQARDTERKSKVGLITAALEEYRIENRTYPKVSSFSELRSELYPDYIDQWVPDDRAGEYSYITPNSTCANFSEGLYYAVDVKLESDKQVTTSGVTSGPCDITTYLSGQYASQDDDSVHYRQSGR